LVAVETGPVGPDLLRLRRPLARRTATAMLDELAQQTPLQGAC